MTTLDYSQFIPWIDEPAGGVTGRLDSGSKLEGIGVSLGESVITGPRASVDVEGLAGEAVTAGSTGWPPPTERDIWMSTLADDGAAADD